MKAKLVVMFRALKSGELFVEEGTVAVMRPGKLLCYGCCKEEEESSSRRRFNMVLVSLPAEGGQ